jgi:hypothetical protein
LDRINSLEGDAVRILAELENLDRELILIDEQVGESAISEEIRRLRERIKAREDGDCILRLGSRDYRIDPGFIAALPLLGNPLIAYFAETLAKAVLPKQRR